MYADIEIFKMEREKIFSTQWICLDHITTLLEVGSYKTYDLFGENIILVKSRNGISAFLNVCPHRGSRLCLGHSGRKTIFTCPYHGWAFDLEGVCVAKRLMFSGEDLSSTRLKKINVLERWGLVFISFDGRMSDHIEASLRLDEFMQAHTPDQLKVASRRQCTTRTNWKLFVENFLECYHCGINHPELSEMESFIKLYEHAGSINEINAEQHFKAPSNRPFVEHFSSDVKARVPYTAGTATLSRDRKTETKSGDLASSLLGDLDGEDGTIIFGMFTPFLHFTLNVDHIVFFIFHPIDVCTTTINILWCVNKDFVTSPKKVDELTWLWKNTIQQDIELTENVQINAGSKHFPDATYHALEYNSKWFSQWCGNMVGDGAVR